MGFPNLARVATRLATACACACALAWAAVPATAGPPTVWVDDDACPGPGSGTGADPFCSIQTAICSIRSTGGGTVAVRPGTYDESLRMFPGVSVVSTDGPAVTTIDADGRPCTTSACQVSTVDLACSAVVFGSGFASSDRLEGFRITGGDGLFRDFGAGRDDSIAGGGIFVFNSAPTITGNEIVQNELTGAASKRFGAGLYLGGGVYAAPVRPVITYNLIDSNVAPPPGAGVYEAAQTLGGGIYVGLYTAPSIVGNTISGNGVAPADVSNGGGLAVYSLSPSVRPVLSRNTIRGNASGGFGGGISFGQIVYYSYGTHQYETAPSFGTAEGNLLVGNQSSTGGGISGGTTRARLVNNTVVDNTAGFAGGIALVETANASDQATAANNIVAFNSGDEVGGLGVGFSDPQLFSNDIFGNIPEDVASDGILGVNGNVSVDPLFVDVAPATRDLRLSPGSPAIDAGVNTFVSAAADLDGDPRIVNGTVDLGAYEASPPGDADGDGVPDGADNCPAQPNAGQEDEDGDDVGDACDACPGDPINDPDGDGLCAFEDNCPTATNPGQQDLDGDGAGDVCDDDDDGDGAADGVDCAPLDPSATATPGPVGPSLRIDAAGGGRLTWSRGAQGHVSNIYRGTFLSTAGWVYGETCFLAATPAAVRVDATAPAAGRVQFYLVSAENACGEGSVGVDPAGDERFAIAPCAGPDADFDGDGLPDRSDVCPLRADAPPGAAPPADADRDFVGDACDVCPGVADPGQADSDRDGAGDACDPCTDRDGDGAGDPGFAANVCALDNCPAIPNPGQADRDRDGLGDACDPCPGGVEGDTDGDGVCDADDAFPGDAGQCGDFDGDGCDDCASGRFDPAKDGFDLDGDGLCDVGDADRDGDGVADGEDCAPADPGAGFAPEPLGATLRVGKGATEEDAAVSWVAGAHTPVVHLYRGTLDAAMPFARDETCWASGVLGASRVDGDSLAPGTGAYYLVAPVNGCGEGAAGSGSDGTPYFALDACPPADDDFDADGLLDARDNCPTVPDSTGLDSDGDGVGDVCDPD